MHVLIEIQPLNKSTGAREAVRVSSAQDRRITGLSGSVWVPALLQPPVLTIRLFDGEGRPVPTRGRRLILADVPPGQDGRIWSLSGPSTSQPIRLLNAPQAVAFTPAGLMVPEELRETLRP